MVQSTTQALLRLMAWLSPAFPVGGFAYSGGLEAAVSHGAVRDKDGLAHWLETLMAHGVFWNDAVLMAEACRVSRNDPEGLQALAALASALCGSRERYQESMALGDAFLSAARQWPHPVFDCLDGKIAYPVAVGAVAAAHGIEAEAVIAAYLHASLSQQVSAAIRLGVLGQTDGVGLVAGLEDDVMAIAHRAATSSLDDLGSAAILAEIASIRHETLRTRLFRS
ncbi:urease accessory protein UreF [Allorhizobium sp. BGMRC 0089]|uniref:urease accessory protein UreF n=1 Tax=Allorhizobium sonneratiae TaxID=2934936 RepID=UPI0020346F9E|nr:urease accessory protein UreF [Allorhizobium sonneratiae]MCM2291042.1 urease accessory protein UreF [Allorhizobium sonneratiae]